jgi:hypothetical protein
MWREPSTHTCCAAVRRRSARAAALDRARPRVGPWTTQNSGPTGSSSRRSSQGCRSSQLTRPYRPGGGPAFAATDKQRAAAVIQIGFAELERFLDA